MREGYAHGGTGKQRMPMPVPGGFMDAFLSGRKFSAVSGTGMGTMREGHTPCAKGTRMVELENSECPCQCPEDLRTHHKAAGNSLPCLVLAWVQCEKDTRHARRVREWRNWKTANAHASAQRIYGRITKRPEILCRVWYWHGYNARETRAWRNL